MTTSTVTPEVAEKRVRTAEDPAYIVTTAADKGGKNLEALDRENFANNALKFVDWDNVEIRTSSRGEYKTTGQQSFYVEDPEGNRIQVNFSANFFPKDRKGAAKPTSGKDSDQQMYSLSPGELGLIDKLATEVAATDPVQGARLMTIGITAKANGNKVPWDLLKLAKDAMDSKG